MQSTHTPRQGLSASSSLAARVSRVCCSEFHHVSGLLSRTLTALHVHSSEVCRGSPGATVRVSAGLAPPGCSTPRLPALVGTPPALTSCPPPSSQPAMAGGFLRGITDRVHPSFLFQTYSPSPICWPPDTPGQSPYFKVSGSARLIPRAALISLPFARSGVTTRTSLGTNILQVPLKQPGSPWCDGHCFFFPSGCRRQGGEEPSVYRVTNHRLHHDPLQTLFHESHIPHGHFINGSLR